MITIAQLRVFAVSQTLCDLNTFSQALEDLADGLVVFKVLTVNICPALVLLLCCKTTWYQTARLRSKWKKLTTLFIIFTLRLLSAQNRGPTLILRCADFFCCAFRFAILFGNTEPLLTRHLLANRSSNVKPQTVLVGAALKLSNNKLHSLLASPWTTNNVSLAFFTRVAIQCGFAGSGG